ncbi:Mce-associated membrane protein [Marmoricola sp. URHA0025 HA25]
MRLTKYALAGLAVLLAAACVVVLVWPTAVPGASAAEKDSDRDLAVRVAATNVTKAFLDVDYRDMDPRIVKVLKLSTGTFKNQYETAKVDLKTQAQQAKAVATGAVRYVGIGDIDDDTAVVYVAADTKVSNASIEQDKSAGKDVDDKRYYRFQLSLSKVGGRWLLNDLQFIS